MSVYKTVNPTLMKYPQKERYCQNPKVLSEHKKGCDCEPTQTCKEFAEDHQFEMMYGGDMKPTNMPWVSSCTNVIKMPSRTSRYDYNTRRYIYTQPPKRNLTAYWNDDEWLSSNLPNIGRYSSSWKHPMKCCCEWLRMHMNNEFSFLKDIPSTTSASLYNTHCKKDEEKVNISKNFSKMVKTLGGNSAVGNAELVCTVHATKKFSVWRASDSSLGDISVKLGQVGLVGIKPPRTVKTFENY